MLYLNIIFETAQFNYQCIHDIICYIVYHMIILLIL